MKAVVWHGRREVRVDQVADPRIVEPTDAIVRITSSGLCGSDLHLYDVLTPFMTPGDVLGHEPMGVVEEVGSGVRDLRVGDRVVVPFNIACGTCFMCDHGLQSQCETTQVHDFGTGASLFGYTKLYGQVPGGQAEYLRVPFADYGPIVVPEGPPDDRFVYLSDVLPTAWQAVRYAGVPEASSVLVLGLGPIGDMCTRVAAHLGAQQVIAVDRVDARLDRAEARGVTVLDARQDDDGDLVGAIRDLTDGRGPDAVIDAVGMEAHGSPVAAAAHAATALIPRPLASRLMMRAGVDRLAALHLALEVVRRGGTVSVIGVYGGMTDPLPMMSMFDKQIQLRMGQANVRRWVDEILPVLGDGADPLGVDGFATHRVPLDAAPEAYAKFQGKEDGTVKVLFQPALTSST
jgi:threonine dehydrogenase-like Zn-dependent dehydrogenase